MICFPSETYCCVSHSARGENLQVFLRAVNMSCNACGIEFRFIQPLFPRYKKVKLNRLWIELDDMLV